METKTLEKENKDKIKFLGYNLFLKFLRTDNSVRVEIDTSEDQYDFVKEIPKLKEDQVYEITIKPAENL